MYDQARNPRKINKRKKNNYSSPKLGGRGQIPPKNTHDGDKNRNAKWTKRKKKGKKGAFLAINLSEKGIQQVSYYYQVQTL